MFSYEYDESSYIALYYADKLDHYTLLGSQSMFEECPSAFLLYRYAFTGMGKPSLQIHLGDEQMGGMKEREGGFGAEGDHLRSSMTMLIVMLYVAGKRLNC